MPRRERRSVVAVEAVGPYTLLRLERGGLEPGVPGQFFMLEAPGRLLPRPMSLCLAPRGRAGVPDRPDRARDGGARRAGAGRRDRTSSARSATATGLDVERPLLVGGGIGMAPLPYLAESCSAAARGARLPHRAPRRGGRARCPNAEVVVEPTLRHRADRPDGRDVLACGPEPMLHAVAALCPDAQLAWEAPMACGYGACYGCVVEIDGELKRLCVEGPVLRVGCLTPPAASTRSPRPTSRARSTPSSRRRSRRCRARATRRCGSPRPTHGMLNSIGLANPGIDRFLAETLPRLARARRPALGLGRRLLRAHEYADTCAAARRATRSPRSSSTSRARTSTRPPTSAAEIVAACRAATRKPLYAKLSAAHAGHRRGRARGRRRRRRRALAREHDPRPRARRADARSRGSRAAIGRLLRAGAEADRARRRARVLRGDAVYRSSAWAASRRAATRSS